MKKSADHMEPLHGEAFVVDDPTYGRGKKWELKEKKMRGKMCPSCDHLEFWLLGWLGERQGEEKGEGLKKKKGCAELNFISRWFFKQ